MPEYTCGKCAAKTVLKTGDVVTSLEDRSYLLELEQVLNRHAQRRSLMRPFVEAYVGIARRDDRSFATAARTFDEVCRALGRACPGSLKAKMDELQETLRQR